MKIVSNLEYNEKRHLAEDFSKEYRTKRPLIPFMGTRAIKKLFNNKSIVSAGQKIIAQNWHSMRMVSKNTEVQLTSLELHTNHRIDLYMIQSPSKDKAIIYFIGSEKGLRQIFIMYSGHPDIFYNQWMKDLGVTELELISNALSFEEEDYDNE